MLGKIFNNFLCLINNEFIYGDFKFECIFYDILVSNYKNNDIIINENELEQLIKDIKLLLNVPTDMNFINIISPIIFPLTYLFIYSKSRKYK